MTGWAVCVLVLAGAVRAGSPGWFLIGLAVGAVNVAALYFWPFAPCLRCKGTGRNRGSNRKRFGECRRCKATGRRARLGARLVHRGAVSLAERSRRKAGKL
jgi:hypothetical protein